MITNILIEQVNVSDDEYKLVEICCESGTQIKKGEHLLSYESSKSVFEYESGRDGIIYLNPELEIDDSYDVGYKIAIVSDSELSDELYKSHFVQSESVDDKKGDKINFTKKAAKLFEEVDLDIDVFKGVEIITEKHILELMKSKQAQAVTDISNFLDADSVDVSKNKGKKRLAVIGAGNAALQLFDATCSNDEHKIVLFYETDKEYINKTLFGLEVKKINNIDEIAKDFKNNIFDEIIISFSGNIDARYSVFNDLVKLKIPIANVVHSRAIISENAQLGLGNLIFANVRIGPFSVVGNNNVISANCSIEHNNVLGDGNTFGPCVVFSGSCIVGNKNRFGTMIGIEPNVCIGTSSVIASGLILTRNVEDNKLVRSLNKIEIFDLDE